MVTVEEQVNHHWRLNLALLALAVFRKSRRSLNKQLGRPAIDKNTTRTLARTLLPMGDGYMSFECRISGPRSMASLTSSMTLFTASIISVIIATMSSSSCISSCKEELLESEPKPKGFLRIGQLQFGQSC